LYIVRPQSAKINLILLFQKLWTFLRYNMHTIWLRLDYRKRKSNKTKYNYV